MFGQIDSLHVIITRFQFNPGGGNETAFAPVTTIDRVQKFAEKESHGSSGE